MASCSVPNVWNFAVNLVRGTHARVTAHPGRDRNATWMPDGERIVFESDRDGVLGLFRKAADGRGEVERLLTIENANYLVPTNWTPDGRNLVFTYRRPLVGRAYSINLGILSLTGQPTWRPLVEREGTETASALSPDGGWLAYESNEAGSPEMYVDSFPEGDQHELVGRHFYNSK